MSGGECIYFKSKITIFFRMDISHVEPFNQWRASLSIADRAKMRYWAPERQYEEYFNSTAYLNWEVRDLTKRVQALEQIELKKKN